MALTSTNDTPNLRAIPSLDSLLKHPEVKVLSAEYGQKFVTDIVRSIIAETRSGMLEHGLRLKSEEVHEHIIENSAVRVQNLMAFSLTPVFNLTGTVLHTNLGRAVLPTEAIEAMVRVASGASNLEFDIASGRRGDRDSHLEDWLRRLTGAEAVTVVNNNAAAVLLTLNSLALRKQVPVSRGELIEIGGAFRMPDIMARAGCKLIEVGTTNRTHLKDFAEAINPRTGLLMTIHTSNYEVHGFTASVAERELAGLAHQNGLPLVNDLGSGTLVDMEQFGLPHERTPAEAIANGSDIVTFSGDKLLGGPQCGIIVGRADLISKIKRNPMKRAMRVDKMTIAALSAVLRLYTDPQRLLRSLPTLRLLTRSASEIEILARELHPVIEEQLKDVAEVDVTPCMSQIGSGAMPVNSLPSMGLTLRPRRGGRRTRGGANRLADGFRRLPVPVIGRVHDGALQLDLRCLEDVQTFREQLSLLVFSQG